MRDPVTFAECRRSSLADNRWWHKNRYSACLIVAYDFEHYRCSSTSCTLVGYEGFLVTTYSVGNAGGSGDPRLFTSTIVTSDYYFDGIDLTPNAPVLLSNVCSPVTSTMTCTPQAGQRRTIAQWGQGAEFRQDFTAAGTGLAGDVDNKTYYDIRFRGVDDQAEVVESDPAPLRCDQASYAERGGCVYTNVTSFFQYSKSDKDVDESAKHIEDAQFSRTNVTPPAADKVIPGGRNSGIQLTRLYLDMTRRTANRTDARAACRQYYGPDYTAGNTLDCDEYPFATTYEGAAYGRPAYAGPNTIRSFSAKALTAADNQTAGRRLGTWYTSDHQLDGDSFFIDIVP